MWTVNHCERKKSDKRRVTPGTHEETKDPEGGGGGVRPKGPGNRLGPLFPPVKSRLRPITTWNPVVPPQDLGS